MRRSGHDRCPGPGHGPRAVSPCLRHAAEHPTIRRSVRGKQIDNDCQKKWFLVRGCAPIQWAGTFCRSVTLILVYTHIVKTINDNVMILKDLQERSNNKAKLINFL